MKKPFVLLVLFFMFANALFADIVFKLYPGLYLGGSGPAISNLVDAEFYDLFTIGGDMQVGFEFGEFKYNNFIFGIHANAGIDTGLPNRPNLYFGIVSELYWGTGATKMGMSLGAGYNTGIDTSKNKNESAYFRFGLPLNFYGVFKTSLCFDIYPDLVYRLGWVMHYGKGFVL